MDIEGRENMGKALGTRWWKAGTGKDGDLVKEVSRMDKHQREIDDPLMNKKLYTVTNI